MPNPGQLEHVRVFRGPSLRARSPVVVASLRHEMCPAAPASQAITRLKAALPGIDVDWPPCSGLTHAHAYALLTARLALAFLNTARGLVQEHGAVASGRQDALLWVGYHQAEVSALALGVALKWVHWAALELSPAHPESSLRALQSETDRLLKACVREHPDSVARILMIAARSRDIPIQQAPMPKTWVYGWGKRSAMFFEASPIDDSAFGTQLARDKFATAALLKYLGYPQSDPRAPASIEEARELLSSMGAPLVVKPPDRGQGQGVSVGVHTLHDMEHAYDLAKSASRSGRVLVERLVEGDDHRLLVVRGKLAAVTRREPASVVGDGQADLRQLVAVLNADRLRNPVLRRYLKQIAFDAVVTRHLAAQGMTPDSKPAPGEKVTLRANANVSSGGTPHDVIELVHPEVKLMAESLAANLGLSSLGVDYMTRDISRPWREIGGAVIEVNTTPGLDLHVSAGMEEAAIGSIVLGEDIGLIPIVLVICSSDRVEFWERQLTENSQLWPAGTAMLGPNLAHLHSMPLLPQGNLYMRMQRLLANQSVTGVVVVSGLEMVLAEGLPAPSATLAILDAPFTDERDPERRLVAQHCSRVVDIRRERIAQVQLMEHIQLALQAAPESSPESAPAACAGSGRSRKHQAGEVELDILSGQALGNEPVVFCIVRNAAYLVPHFLRHYRSLGAVQFVFFDDQSTDGTRELLMQQPDAMVLASSHRFHHQMSNGKPLHQNLRNWIPESLGRGRWVITVDADELLILPAEAPTIPEMTHCLDARGHTTVMASMLDFFPQTLAARNHDASLSPFLASPFFDLSKGFSRDANGRPRKTAGGIRWRLQEWLRTEKPEVHRRIFSGQGYTRAARAGSRHS